jgi:signal transduction histidine kinase
LNAATEHAEPSFLRVYAPAWMVLLLGLLATGGAANWFWKEAETLDAARFYTAVTNLTEHLDTRTERYAEQLERLKDMISPEPNVSSDRWELLVKRLEPEANLPAFVELAYATNAAMQSPARLWEAIKQANRFDPSGVPIMPRPPTADFRVVHQTRYRSVVTPHETEVWLREPAITNEWDSTLNSRIHSTLPRSLVDTNGESYAAVSLFETVFATDLMEWRELVSIRNANIARNRQQALLIGTIGWPHLMETSFAGGMDQVAFEAFACARTTNEIRLENWMGMKGKKPCPVLSEGFAPRFQTTREWRFYRERWQLVFYTTERFDLQSTHVRGWFVLAGGTTISLLVSGLLGVQSRSRRNQERISEHLRLALSDLGTARKERERLSHDLHDGAIQSLYAMQLSLSRATDQAEAAQPILGQRLSEIRRNLTSVIGELRGFILQHEAKPGPTGNLAGVLSSIVERLSGTTESALHTRISAAAANHLNSEQAVHLANLAREAISNALRHAHPKEVTITLREEVGSVVLEIRDNGCGFDTESRSRSGVGLTSMAIRAREAGGEWRIESTPGEGTSVAVTIPVDLANEGTERDE